MKIFFQLVFLCLFSLATATQAAIRTDEIEYFHDSIKLKGYLYYVYNFNFIVRFDRSIYIRE